jgi:hypothetical protein
VDIADTVIADTVIADMGIAAIGIADMGIADMGIADTIVLTRAIADFIGDYRASRQSHSHS